MKKLQIAAAALMLSSAMVAASQSSEEFSAPFSQPGIDSKATMISLIAARKADAPEIMVAAMEADPERTLELFATAIEQAPELIMLMLTAAIGVSPVEMHQALYQLAIAAGLDPDDALVAAVTGGADPTLLAQAPAAGPGNTSSEAPSVPAPGSAGGGSGSVSPN